VAKDKELKDQDDVQTKAAELPTTSVTEADMIAIKHAVKANLDKQERVQVRLIKADKDAPNFETVCINGYIFQIMRGVDVMVPTQVKEILAEAGLI
jgi:hypothetical protein